MNQTWNAI